MENKNLKIKLKDEKDKDKRMKIAQKAFILDLCADDFGYDKSKQRITFK